MFVTELCLLGCGCPEQRLVLRDLIIALNPFEPLRLLRPPCLRCLRLGPITKTGNSDKLYALHVGLDWNKPLVHCTMLLADSQQGLAG